MTAWRQIVSEPIELLRTVVAVIIGIILALILLVAVSRAPGHQELFERQQLMEEQLRYVSCLLLIPQNERIPESVAACQLSPASEPTG